MKVQLQIGSNYFHLDIVDAAKVMEMLNKAQPCDTYWIPGYNGRESESGLRAIKSDYMTINQVTNEPITSQQYEQRYRLYREAADAEKAAKSEAE